jgi:UPF0755 protein
VRVIIQFLLVLALAFGGWAFWWLGNVLPLTAPTLDLSVEPGTTPRGVAQATVDSGVQTSPELLYWWFRLSGQARQIKAGSYELATGLTPYSLLRKLTRGEEALRSVTLVEGWTFKQVRAALLKEELSSRTPRVWVMRSSWKNWDCPDATPKAVSTRTPTPLPKAAAT